MFLDTLLDQAAFSLKTRNDQHSGLLLRCADALRFKVDNVAFYLRQEWLAGKHEQGHLDWPVEDRIPNVAPTAPTMWFEYTGDAIGGSPHHRFGCLLIVDYDSHLPDQTIVTQAGVRWGLRALAYCQDARGLLSGDWEQHFLLNEAGQILKKETRPNLALLEAYPHYQFDEKRRHTWRFETVTALLSLCFTHCKGVTIREHQPTRQVRRAAARSGKPVYAHHTIDVQAVDRVLRQRDVAADGEITKALHIARGHFAHYSAEHPLFGKYVGTVYRPMHVRGRAKNGIVTKDYRVHR